jgi:hypothetical protein
MPFLIERPAGPALELPGNLLLVGRGTNAGLRLDGEAVALEHARLERDPAGYRLSDLGSVTGTYLNGKPVENGAYLKEGDGIGIGGWLLRVRRAVPAGPLELALRPAVAETETPAQAGGAPVQAPEVDYAGAYALRRPFLTKGSLALLLTLAAAGVTAALPLAKAWPAFQPGAISEKHTRKEVGCFDCHTPWKGPTATSCGASGCHPRLDHQPRQATTPSCADCHFEHRGQERLSFVSDAGCVACHGDLKVKDGGEPAFARQITGFPHADFSITLADGRRLPLAEAAAGQADPGTVRLNHAFHLKPGLIGPAGREQLTCASCHQPDPSDRAPTGLLPVQFEQHCRRCHQLTFDEGRPEAPHVAPREVHSFLVAAYQVDEGDLGSFRERRRTGLRAPGSNRGVDLSPGARARVVEAENKLYRTDCAKCHAVDLEARPFPTVAPAHLQGSWLPHSRFDHRQHSGLAGLTCEGCHTAAAASTATADVLLPGIAVCGGCHGDGQPPAGATLRPGRSDCRGCHTYHPGATIRSAAVTLTPRTPLPPALPAPGRGGATTQRSAHSDGRGFPLSRAGVSAGGRGGQGVRVPTPMRRTR